MKFMKTPSTRIEKKISSPISFHVSRMKLILISRTRSSNLILKLNFTLGLPPYVAIGGGVGEAPNFLILCAQLSETLNHAISNTINVVNDDVGECRALSCQM